MIAPCSNGLLVHDIHVLYWYAHVYNIIKLNMLKVNSSICHYELPVVQTPGLHVRPRLRCTWRDVIINHDHDAHYGIAQAS